MSGLLNETLHAEKKAWGDVNALVAAKRDALKAENESLKESYERVRKELEREKARQAELLEQRDALLAKLEQLKATESVQP